MGKALIVYASRSGGTKRLAQMLADEIKAQGKEVEVKPVAKIKSKDELKGYDAYLFGSAILFNAVLENFTDFNNLFILSLVSNFP